MNIVDKFTRYVKFDTQSDEISSLTPSTLKQLELGRQLVKECEEIGFDDVKMNKYGIVYATVNATAPGYDSIGFVAHMDTATEISGKDVNPRIIHKYDGSTIELNDRYSMSPKAFPHLNKVIGDDLIVTDGNTLLGADDKAGIAIIMQAMDELIHSDTKHGKIRVAFTCDEEVGRGTDHFNVKEFGVDYAYTVDGGAIDQVSYENFNAARAKVVINGTSIHPGDAKGKMVNASTLASEFVLSMPKEETPECTEGYEGFYHLIDMKSSVDKAKLVYIIRDHSKEKFIQRKQFMIENVQKFNDVYGSRFNVVIMDEYPNMANYIHDMTVVEKELKAIENVGITPGSKPVRGGTDGARLTELGLICPNLGTGSYNHHGRYEFASVQKMEKMVEIVKNIVTL